MRLIKSQTTNARVITGAGIKYDPSTDITSLDGNVMLIPKGTTADRPIGVEGYIRYNTDLLDFEFYQDGAWRLNGYNQPTFISNEIFYSGFDKQDTLFGPLSNIVSENESMLNPDNTLVFVDQRFNTPHKDYTFLVDPDEIGIGAEISTARIRKGDNYQIIYPGNTDFTNIGASSSLVGTTFTADYTLQVSSTTPKSNPSTAATGDNFGYDIDVSNEKIVVGAPLEYSATGEVNAGSVYVYDSIGTLVQKIVNPRAAGEAQDDQFGSSVAINNQWIAVGAWRDDDTIATGNMSGRVYLYNLSAMTGAPTCTLINPDVADGDAEDWFGYDVALSDTHLIVGSPKGDPAGKAYIYDLNDLAHPAQPKAVLENPIAGSNFGETVAINDVYAIVSAHTQDTVYVFEVSSGDLLFTLDNPNNDATDMFGLSLDMSNDYVIVGAPGWDSVAGSNSGRIYVYDIKGHNPTEPLYQIINPNAYVPEDEDYFGYRVAISDGFFMASAHQEDDAGGVTDTGRVYTFDIADGELVESIVNPNVYAAGSNDRYGTALAAYGNVAVVGAHEEDNATTSASGAFYIHNILGKGEGDGLVRRTGTFIKFKEPLNEAAITKIRNEDGSTKIDFDFDVNNLRITLIYLNQKMDVAESPDFITPGSSASSSSLPDLTHLAPINGSILNQFSVSQLHIGMDWKLRASGNQLQFFHDNVLIMIMDATTGNITSNV